MKGENVMVSFLFLKKITLAFLWAEWSCESQEEICGYIGGEFVVV